MMCAGAIAVRESDIMILMHNFAQLEIGDEHSSVLEVLTSMRDSQSRNIFSVELAVIKR